MNWTLLGNIIGYIAIAENIFLFLSVKRERVLIFKLISDVLWALNMAFLSIENRANLTGAILNAIAIFREIVFYNRLDKNWAKSKFWLFFFIGVTLISPIVSWSGPISLLPAFGSIFAVILFYSKNTDYMRYLSFLAQGLWLIYASVIISVPAIISNAILILSSIIGIIRSFILKKKAKREQLVTNDNLPKNTANTETI